MARSDANRRLWFLRLRWAGRAFLLCTLLLPFLLAAVDHHGNERLPTHAHTQLARDLDAARQATAHTHGFEVDHAHDGRAEASTEGTIVFVSPSAAAHISSRVTTATAIGFFSLALLAMTLVAASRRRINGTAPILTTPQGMRWSPPRRPPRLAVSF